MPFARAHTHTHTCAAASSSSTSPQISREMGEKKKKYLRSIWRTTWRKKRYTEKQSSKAREAPEGRATRRQRAPCDARKNTAGRWSASGTKTCESCDSSGGRTEAMRAEAARPERAALPAFSTLATKASLAAEQRTVVLFILFVCGERKGGDGDGEKESVSLACVRLSCVKHFPAESPFHHQTHTAEP